MCAMPRYAYAAMLLFPAFARVVITVATSPRQRHYAIDLARHATISMSRDAALRLAAGWPLRADNDYRRRRRLPMMSRQI